ncbi:DUF2946 domain-containing protein [Paraburkholderia saeva]|jgi:hypothetical protein|uniref:DUF2946 domain-containing protein n=1 Tax=Paraburkholderia saeva TaxID=2777537 RepID=A0A9N8S2B3_9BURK|nr:DUF2946 domain-containing protein [Paraburkholderia saeva]CAG4922939.1 hypothetical protein LMG31841_05240 [Paraburkholderia saeva]
MLRAGLQKIGCILGLLAILMATLAPTISQAMAASSRVDDMLSVYCSAQSQTSPDDGGNKSASHTTMSHLQACGYCNLLAHAPVLPTAMISFEASVWVIQHRAMTRFEHLQRVLPLTSAQPRAPPFAS